MAQREPVVEAHGQVGAKESATASPVVEVVYALPQRQRVVRLELPATGFTAREAIERSGLLEEFPQILESPLVVGIFGVGCELDRALHEGDRVEIYRPLRHDPRAARRQRAARGAPRARTR